MNSFLKSFQSICLLIFTILIGVAGYHAYHSFIFLRNSEKVRAKITKIETSVMTVRKELDKFSMASGDWEEFVKLEKIILHITFDNKFGEKVNTKLIGATSNKMNEEVEILYDPNNIKTAKLNSFWGVWSSVIVYGCWAFAFLFIGNLAWV